MKKSKLLGSRAEVWHGTAQKTAGRLRKTDLMKNKRGRIVSVRKHKLGKKAFVKNGLVAKTKSEMAMIRG